MGRFDPRTPGTCSMDSRSPEAVDLEMRSHGASVGAVTDFGGVGRGGRGAGCRVPVDRDL